MRGPAATSRLERVGEIGSQVASLSPEDPRLRRGLRAGIALIVVLSVGLAIAAAFSEFPDVELRFRPLWLLLGLLIFCVHVLANSEIWRRLLGALGPELRPGPAVAIWSTSALGRYVPTSLLLPLVRTAMAERQGVPKRICLASVFYEAAFVLTAAILLGAYFVIDLPALQNEPERFAVLIFPLVAFVLLYPAIFHRAADYALRRLGRETLPVVLSAARCAQFVALSAVTLAIAGGAVYALAQAIYPVAGGDAITVIGAYSVASALGILAFMLPGGLGAREAAMTLALSPVMPTAPAVAVAVLTRVAQIAAEVIFAALTPLLLGSGREPAPDPVAGGNYSAR